VIGGDEVVADQQREGEHAAHRTRSAVGASPWPPAPSGSPAILLRSGIGPAAALAGLGIEPVADLPGVGANLADHPVTRLLLVPTPGSCDPDTPLAQVVARYTAPASGEFNDMTAAAVQLTSSVRVIFQPAEMRQHLRPAPLIVAQRRPLVVVGRNTAKRDRSIDRRGAPDDPTTWVGNNPAGHRHCGQAPVVRGAPTAATASVLTEKLCLRSVWYIATVGISAVGQMVGAKSQRRRMTFHTGPEDDS
jgi:hypothetical protein